MSRPGDVLAVMDRQLRNRAERANRYTRSAEKAARKAGQPQITADRMAEYESLLLSELREARAVVAELIEASHEYFTGYCVDEADDDCSGGNGFDTGCTPDQHRAANRLRRALNSVGPVP